MLKPTSLNVALPRYAWHWARHDKVEPNLAQPHLLMTARPRGTAQPICGWYWSHLVTTEGTQAPMAGFERAAELGAGGRVRPPRAQAPVFLRWRDDRAFLAEALKGDPAQ